MLRQHHGVRGELGQDDNFGASRVQARHEKHNLHGKVNDFIGWSDLPVGDFEVARRDGAHPLESTSFERDHPSSICRRALRKDANWSELLVLNFDLLLASNEGLDESVSLRLGAATLDINRLNCIGDASDDRDRLDVGLGGEARHQRRGYHIDDLHKADVLADDGRAGTNASLGHPRVGVGLLRLTNFLLL